ncbi:MAG: type II toxin-antitoxin system HicB family antitoxin [Rudaea sp.]
MTTKHYPLDIFWSEEDKGFIAEARDLPGCSAWGASEEDAAREARSAIESWIAAAKAARRKIPAPTATLPIESYSGKFIVRVPKDMHARLARDARKQGVSLNQYILSRL